MAVDKIISWVITVVMASWAPCFAAGNRAPVVPVVGFFPAYLEASEGCLLGGFADGQWLKAKAAASLMKGGDTYRLYSLAGEVGTGVGSKPAEAGKDHYACRGSWLVTLSGLPASGDFLVAVGGSFNAMPRRPKIMDPGQQAYRMAAAEILKSHGLTNPKVRLTQVIRVDLDGDGVEEVLVTATNYQYSKYGNMKPEVRAGDYSLVFLRQVVHGKIVTTVITGEYYPHAKKFTAPMEHKVCGLADFNGDGIMEIVLFGRYYEGEGVAAYRLEGTGVLELFRCGCGF